MFKKFLNSIGIGTATVNLVLHNEHVRIGDEVSGVLYVKGGSDDTQIDAIHVDLTMKAVVEKGDEKREITQHVHRVTVTTNLQSRAGEELSFPFRTTIPLLPVSSYYVKYHFHTSLDIPRAIDKHDVDQVILYPNEPMAVVLESLVELGFRESNASGMYDGKRYQEFEFKPVSGRYRGQLDEIEVIFVHQNDGLRLYIELDRKNKGLFGGLLDSLDLDESRHNVLIPYQVLNSKQETVRALDRFLASEL